MRIKLLIISFFVSAVCFGQGIKTNNQTGGTNNVVIDGRSVQYLTKEDTAMLRPPKDSLNIPVITMKEFNAYLNRISLAAMKQFDLTEKAKYDAILKELLAIQAEVDKKRKTR